LADTGPVKELARRLSELDEKLSDDARDLKALADRYIARSKEVKGMKGEAEAMRAALSEKSWESEEGE
jgi:hypothetical protein